MSIVHSLYLLFLSVLGLAFLFNILNIHIPHLPGDIYIDRPGITLYIPVTSAILITIALSLILGNLIK